MSAALWALTASFHRSLGLLFQLLPTRSRSPRRDEAGALFWGHISRYVALFLPHGPGVLGGPPQPQAELQRCRSQHVGLPSVLPCLRQPPPPHHQHRPCPSLTTSSAKRTLSSSGFGMGLENSMYCRGLLSRRLISGRSPPPKQHRKPRPWRLLLRGAMVTAGQGDSQQAGALGPHRDLGRTTESTEWSGMATR